MLRRAEFSHAPGHTSALVSAGCLVSKDVLAQKQCRCAQRQLTAVQLFSLGSFEYVWLLSSRAGKSNIPEPYPKVFQHPIQNIILEPSFARYMLIKNYLVNE